MSTWTLPTLALPDFAWALLLLPTVVLLWAISRRQRQRALESWGASSFWIPIHRRLGRWLLFLLMAGLILGLMGLQWGKETITPTTSVRDLFLAVDVSQSMLAEDRPPLSRLQRARQAILELLTALRQEKSQTRVGLIVFAGNARLLSPPTLDLQHIQQLVEGLSPESLGMFGRLKQLQDGTVGTSLASLVPLLQSWDKLHSANRESIECLVISDGDDLGTTLEETLWSNVPYRVHAWAVGDATKAWPIPFQSGYLMLDKNDGSAPERVLTQRRDDILSSLIRLKSGSFQSENGSPQPLVDWWQKQAGEVPTYLLESQARIQPINRSAWLIGVSGIILLLEVTFGGARQRRW